MALAPGFRADFRESLYRMIGALTGAEVTILSTVEVEDTFTELSFSHYAISFLTDDISPGPSRSNIAALLSFVVKSGTDGTHGCCLNFGWR